MSRNIQCVGLSAEAERISPNLGWAATRPNQEVWLRQNSDVDFWVKARQPNRSSCVDLQRAVQYSRGQPAAAPCGAACRLVHGTACTQLADDDDGHHDKIPGLVEKPAVRRGVGGFHEVQNHEARPVTCDHRDHQHGGRTEKMPLEDQERGKRQQQASEFCGDGWLPSAANHPRVVRAPTSRDVAAGRDARASGDHPRPSLRHLPVHNDTPQRAARGAIRCRADRGQPPAAARAASRNRR